MSFIRAPRRRSVRRWAALAAAGAVAASVVSGLGIATPTAVAATPTEVTSGAYRIAPLVDYPDSSTPLSLHTVQDSNFTPDGVTLRLGSARESTLPEDPAYSWLGKAGDPGWVTGDLYTEPDVPNFNPEFDSLDTSQLASGDAGQQLSIKDVDGPGTFAWYEVGLAQGTTGAAAPLAGGYRLGTATQRDGTAQSPLFTVPDDIAAFQQDMVGRFSAAGMYCITFAYSAHPASSKTRIAATDTVRFAVGDSVATDAPCGTVGSGDSGSQPPGGGGNPPPGGGGTDPSDPNSQTGPTGDTIWTDGHVDVLHPMIDTDTAGKQTLKLRAHDDRETRDWNDVVYYSSDVIKEQLPATYAKDADYSFAGSPGQTVWNSPQDQKAGAPWAGLSTEDDTLAASGSVPYQFRLDAVTGPAGQPAPGDLALWVVGAEHGTARDVYASTRTGLPAGLRVPRNTHAHFNWTFTKPGVYCLAFTVEAPLADGTRQTASEQLTMAVGSSIDPTTVTPCGLTQPYPTPASSGKPFVADTAATPVLIDNGAAAFAPRLSGDALSVGLRREDGYLAKPGVTDDIDDAIVHVPFGARPPYDIESTLNRGQGIQLAWDTTGVARDALRGDITWSLDPRGPGGVSTTEYGESQHPFDTIDGHTTSRQLWPDAQANNAVWDVGRPGKYCLGMTWSATLADGKTVSDHHVLTLVVDGPLDPRNYGYNTDPNGPEYVTSGPSFTHTADTLTKTCAQGAEPTDPSDVPVDGGSTPPGSGGSTPPGSGGSKPVNSGRDVLKIGHMDVMSTVTEGNAASAASTNGAVRAAAASGNTLKVTVHDDNTSPATIHDPAKSTFYAAQGARTVIPAGAQYRFLGSGGKPVWILPQTQDPSLLWPGWNVDLTKAPQATGVQWTLNSVKGPGDFALFENTGFGDVKVLLDSDDAAHKSFRYNQHAHANWAFNADGVYCLNSTFAALPTSLAAAQQTTLLVAVGNVDPAVVTPADCGKTAQQVGKPAPSGTGTGNGTHTPSSFDQGTGPGSAKNSPLLATGTHPDGSDATPTPCQPMRVTSHHQASVEVASSGHFDFGSRVIGGKLTAAVKDGRNDPATWRDTAGLVFQVGPAAQQTVPAGYSFLGQTGAKVWVIPQTQLPNIPWLGWNTQDPSVINGTSGPVTFSIANLTGPGKLAVYTTGSFGGVEDKVFGTAAGFPRSFAVDPNVHAHANWAFTAPGVYRLTMTQTARLRSGAPSSTTATLAFSVGGGDPHAAAPSITTTHLVGHTTDGQACTLAAGSELTGGPSPADTGTDVRSGLLTAFAVLVLGGIALAVGRRRRRPTTP